MFVVVWCSEYSTSWFFLLLSFLSLDNNGTILSLIEHLNFNQHQHIILKVQYEITIGIVIEMISFNGDTLDELMVTVVAVTIMASNLREAHQLYSVINQHLCVFMYLKL